MENGKRKPLLARKPALVVAIGMGKPKGPPPMGKDTEMEEDDELTCPKCGAQLADTPENRKYAKMREDEMDESDDESEYEDED